MASSDDSSRRDLIVEAALERLVTLGYEGTTIGDIAKDLAISKAAVGYYFRRKDDFLDEFVTPALDALEGALTEADDVEGGVAAYLRVLIDNQRVARWIDTDPVIRSHEIHGPRLDELNERFVELVAGPDVVDSDRLRALAALGSLWRPVRELDHDVLDAQFNEIVLVALEPVS